MANLLTNGHIPLDRLPEIKNLTQKDDSMLIHAIDTENAQALSKAENSRRDMLEYYTLWAHQIKTPIAAMRLILQAEAIPSSGELNNELFKIEQYADMVLSYLRMGSTSTDYVIQSYSLESIVKQAVHKYAFLFIQKKIALQLKPIDCTVLTDEKWLCFVIEQLLSNALKYTPSGSISIYVKSPETLVIEDTGIGIAPEDFPRLGEKGFTGYNGHSDKKSTGIGLYLCKQILGRLSHTMTIESEQGKGTRVYIHLDNVSINIE